MVDREQYIASFDLIHYRMLDVLRDWMMKEKNNLDSFIANPTSHVNYDPYVEPNWDALRLRSTQLGQVGQLLGLIIGFKTGGDFVHSQVEYAFDNIPAVIFKRLYDWMEGRYNQMEKQLIKKNIAPIDEYSGLAEFNKTKFMEEMAVYKESMDGVMTVMRYKTQG